VLLLLLLLLQPLYSDVTPLNDDSQRYNVANTATDMVLYIPFQLTPTIYKTHKN
jgi:hypothetical protein